MIFFKIAKEQSFHNSRWKALTLEFCIDPDYQSCLGEKINSTFRMAKTENEPARERLDRVWYIPSQREVQSLREHGDFPTW